MNLLTTVVARLIDKKNASGEYGVSVTNLPALNYVELFSQVNNSKPIAVFFIGFTGDEVSEIKAHCVNSESISFFYTVEEAESSRNSGDESIFRVLIVKRSDLEKISSLQWFQSITLRDIYLECVKVVKERFSGNLNSTVKAMLEAFGKRSIQNILSFERIVEYLEALVSVPDVESLPSVLRKQYYLLGLCADRKIDAKNPTSSDIISRVKYNHDIIQRIENLEQNERQSITNYATDTEHDIELPRLILQYYKTKEISLLAKMDIEDVDNCLKSVRKESTKPTPSLSNRVLSPTSVGAQLVFDDNSDVIDTLLDKIKEEEEQQKDKEKPKISVSAEGYGKIQYVSNPVTLAISDDMTGEDDFGGTLLADVESPADAISNIDKYTFNVFNKGDLTPVFEYLDNYTDMGVEGAVEIKERLQAFIKSREVVAPFRKRLQDVPMLQVISKSDIFANYLADYEALLNTVNQEISRLWDEDPGVAKYIVNMIVSLDYVYIVGRHNIHAVPTPLNPLYLWKYIKLSDEIKESRGVEVMDEAYLSEDDKSFIIRKSEDIPDPLSVMLVPSTVLDSIGVQGAQYLPLAGKMGCLPIYSTQAQINTSENGKEELKQNLVRYLCLYPHAGMMLRLSVIDPPSIEFVVSVLKALERDKDFEKSGIEVNVFRTKKASESWGNISDSALNEGMLGSVRGRLDSNFRFHIVDTDLSYDKILEKLSCEQHVLCLFEPSEIVVKKAPNEKLIHIHPLCVPKVYKYSSIGNKIEIRPSNEGGIFTTYSSIIEKLNEQPSIYTHTTSSFNTPLKQETYERLLNKTDWLVILDQSLKSWDLSFQTASEKLYYKESDYRSIGIYSRNSKKFVKGYDNLVRGLGNFVPNDAGINGIIESIRKINNDGLLSIVSHSTNRIFDERHGKGSLGLAIAAIHYKRKEPASLLVGLDTQLAQTWLSNRDDDTLPDMVGIIVDSENHATIDLMEVKTYSNSDNAFSTEVIDDEWYISGHAVEQVSILEDLIKEIFGKAEKITTISRREVLRQQVYECLYQSKIEPNEKKALTASLNSLFAGAFAITVRKTIFHIDFNQNHSCLLQYRGKDKYLGNLYWVDTIGQEEIQSILTNQVYLMPECSKDTHLENTENPSPEDFPAPIPEMSAEEISRLTSRVETPDDHIDDAPQGHDEPPMVSSTPNSDETPKSSDKEALKTNISDRVREKCQLFNKALRSFNISAEMVEPEDVTEAARFTRFKVQLRRGESIKNLERRCADLALQLEASGRIIIGQIPSTSYLAIDVPYEGGTTINLLDHLNLLDSSKGNLNTIAGQKPSGDFRILDVAKAPHLLVSGTTGSGKSVFLYTLLVCWLKQYSPDELQLLIIDPKQTDFVFFDDIIPYLYGGKVIYNAEEAIEAIKRVNEVDLEERTKILHDSRCRDILSYNRSHPDSKMKRLVIVIDEYSNLIRTTERLKMRNEFESMMMSLAERVRNIGINLIIATQHPKANIVTSTLKANIPYRISFRLPSNTDSMTILDMAGAEDLLGKGDMLMVTDEGGPERLQGLYISEEELENFIASIKRRNP